MAFEFKPLEIKLEGSRIKQIYKSKQVRKTFLYMLLGAVISLGISYASEGSRVRAMNAQEIGHALIMGAFFGFFITNNPCSRGKC